jgi:hypothetical protein
MGEKTNAYRILVGKPEEIGWDGKVAAPGPENRD